MNWIYCRHKKAWGKYNSEWGVDEIIGEIFGDVVIILYLCGGIQSEDRMKTNLNLKNIYYMKHRCILFPLFIIIGFSLFGFCVCITKQKITFHSSQMTVSNIQDSIQALKNDVASLQDSVKNILAKNPDLDLQMKMNQLEKEVEKYRWDFGQSVDNYNDKIAIWLAIITLLIAAFGLAIPYVMNSKSEKHMEKLLQDAKDKADKAENALNDLQPKVRKAEDVASTIEELSSNLEKTAKKAKAVHYFIQALQEADNKRAISLFSDCIDEDKQFAEAYFHRGVRKRKIKDDLAMKNSALYDFTRAIDLKEKTGYPEALNYRGIIYFESNATKEAKIDFEKAIGLNYPEAYLNLGLLKYSQMVDYETPDDIDKAIDIKSDFAEAYYIRGLWEYLSPLSIENDEAIKDFIKAKDFKPNVFEDYPNRHLLKKELKNLDNSFYRVEYSKDMTKLIRVPKDKENKFIIPNFVTKILDEAFKNCTQITSIEIPASVKEIGSQVFHNCSNLNEIVVDTNNTEYCSEQGILYSKNKAKLIAISVSKESISISGSVANIEAGALWTGGKLKEIHLEHKSLKYFSEIIKYLKQIGGKLYVPKGLVNVYQSHPQYSIIKIQIHEENN